LHKGGGIVSLTPKQEMFIQGIVSGLSQREAYKQAYNTSKMKDETIDVKASVMFNNDKIRIRYDELIEQFKEKALYTREEAVNDLIWIKEKAKEDIENPKRGLKQANGTVFLNSIKELCLLNDLYPDKKAKEEENQENDIAQVLKEALEGI
jgi:hypothetical protein